MQQWVELFPYGCHGAGSVRICSWISDCKRLRQVVLGRCALLDAGLKIPVHPQDMVRDHPVAAFIYVVRHDEQQIETRQ